MSKFNWYRLRQSLETSCGEELGLYRNALPTSYTARSGMTMLYFPWTWFCLISSASFVPSSSTNHFRITEASSIYMFLLILLLGIYELWKHYSNRWAPSCEIGQSYEMSPASFYDRGLGIALRYQPIGSFLLWSFYTSVAVVEYNIGRCLCQDYTLN